MPKSNNHNEAITHLAMPERAIPVLVKCPAGSPDGFMPDESQAGGVVGVCRLSRSLVVERLKTEEGWLEVEREYGAISKSKWTKLLELLALIERFSAGDGSPVVTFDESEVEVLGRLLDRLSPGGWYKHNGPKGERYHAVSGNVQFQLTPEPFAVWPIGTDEPKSALAPRGQEGPGRSLSIHATVMTPALSISEALTRGLRAAKLVIWWAQMERKLAPGLFCPDIVTALYALLLSGIGSPGGVAVCQRCKTPFIRSKGVQLYCGHRCQVAAGMKRYRANIKRRSAAKSKAEGKSRKPTSKG